MGTVAGITIAAQTGQQIAPRLAQLAARLADLTPVMEDIGAILERNVQGRFDTKTDPAGRPWAPLAARTRVAYAKAKVGGSLLERTRMMRESLSSQADKDSVVIGFGRAYAAYHEFGTARMPRRGMLTVDPQTGTLADEDTASILDLIQSYLTP